MPNITGETERFHNITVLLHHIGESNYRIEWTSKMTKGSTNLVKTGKNRYVVIRKWPETRSLPDVATNFTSRNAAFVHFIKNVDVIKCNDEAILKAKQQCLDYFTRCERINSVVKTAFPKPRLQGALGREVIVKHKRNLSDIAKGHLLQLIGNKAEIQITQRYTLCNPNPKLQFDTTQVYLP
ncbi:MULTISPECIES: hypothetical protein [unclassified Pseudoalteromonas]|uniref:hypothetical protein n=1 Tax=unclassified Pseudoalteromonas TaxID=194690 RepID=UPI00301501A9